MNKVVGFAMCGSFCTFKEVIPQIEMLKKLAEIADKNIEAMAPEEVAEEDSDVPKKQEKDSTKKNQKS